MDDKKIQDIMNEEYDKLPSPEFTEPKQRRKKGRWFPFSAVLLPVLIFFILLSYFPIQRGKVALTKYIFQLDVEEGFILNQAVSILKGQPIYKSIQRPPYLVSNYGPVYPFILSKLMEGNVPNIQIGRALSIASLFGILMAMTSIVLFKTRSLIPALLCPLLMLITYDTYEQLPLARVDTLALFFAISGIMAITIEDTFGSRYLALVLFLAAIFTKINMLAAPLAAAIFLLIKNRHIGKRWIITFLILMFGILITLSIYTKNEFIKHTILYNANKFSFEIVKAFALNHLRNFYTYTILCSLLLFVYEIIRAFSVYFKSPISSGDFNFFNYVKFSIKQIDIIYYYYVFALLTFIQIGKVGSATNYLLEMHIAVSLIICIKLGECFHVLNKFKWKNGAALAQAIILSIIITAFLYMHSYNTFNVSVGKPNQAYSFRNFTPKDLIYTETWKELAANKGSMFWIPEPSQQDFDNCTQILSFINDHPGPLLSEEVMFNIILNRNVEFQPFIMSQLAKEKKWKQDDFLKKLRQGYFSVIVSTEDLTRNPAEEGVSFERYTNEMVKEIQYRYRFIKKYKGPAWEYYIYIPRKWDSEKFNYFIAFDVYNNQKQVEG